MERRNGAGYETKLLLDGDKTGNDRWYDENVPVADRLYDEHIETLENNDG